MHEKLEQLLEDFFDDPRLKEFSKEVKGLNGSVDGMVNHFRELDQRSVHLGYGIINMLSAASAFGPHESGKQKVDVNNLERFIEPLLIAMDDTPQKSAITLVFGVVLVAFKRIYEVSDENAELRELVSAKESIETLVGAAFEKIMMDVINNPKES